jgi:hypothetical protein
MILMPVRRLGPFSSSTPENTPTNKPSTTLRDQTDKTNVIITGARE